VKSTKFEALYGCAIIYQLTATSSLEAAACGPAQDLAAVILIMIMNLNFFSTVRNFLTSTDCQLSVPPRRGRKSFKAQW
jgi:hypothetical protein